MIENIGPGHGLESSRATSGWKGAAVEADAIGEQQLKRTQSGSSSCNDSNRGAVENLTRTQAASSTRNLGVAAEADAIREQLKARY